MSNALIHLDSFQSVDTPTRKTRYEDFREAVLEAGRFSSFEATANDTASAMFTRLCRDPTVITRQIGYPWTAVERRGA